MAFVVKIYIVQKANAKGELYGPVLAAKMTHAAAHAIAKKHAPAKVTFIVADKTELENGPDFVQHQDEGPSLKLITPKVG